MDVNDLRTLVILLSFVIFAGIVKWALAPRNRAHFDAAQQLPFQGDAPAATPSEPRDE
jgi:cbb3-type cytochrome oxidase subunit 3